MRTDPITKADLQQMILFKVDGKCGFPLRNALDKRYTGLDGRDDKVFLGSKSSISIRLEVRLRVREIRWLSLMLFPVALL